MPAAVQQLVDMHRQFLAFLERRVESRETAEDILQTAFVTGLQRAEEVSDDEHIVPWFYRVLRNAVIDHYRRRASASRALDAWGKELINHEAPAPDVKDELCACIAELAETLKSEYQSALRIVDLEDGSLNDLAQQSGITANNAAVRIHRAREALRKQVKVACGTCAEHGCVDCTCKPKQSGGCHAGNSVG